jgi:hypothetical protein
VTNVKSSPIADDLQQLVPFLRNLEGILDARCIPHISKLSFIYMPSQKGYFSIGLRHYKLSNGDVLIKDDRLNNKAFED